MLIRDRDRHVLARTDVGDRNCEEIRTLLREQRSLLAFALGFFVGLLRVLLLLDLAFDDAIAHFHAQRVDDGVLRQRKGVNRLDAHRLRIEEALRDLAAKNHPAHVEIDVGLHRRRGDVDARLLCFQKERAAFDLVERDLGGSGNRNQKCDEKCELANHRLSLRSTRSAHAVAREGPASGKFAAGLWRKKGVPRAGCRVPLQSKRWRRLP